MEPTERDYNAFTSVHHYKHQPYYHSHYSSNFYIKYFRLPMFVRQVIEHQHVTR